VHTVKPTPITLFEDVLARHMAVVSIEEHSRIGGFGESLLSFAASQGSRCKIEVLGTGDSFMHLVGSQDYARRHFQIASNSVSDAAVRALRQ